MLTVHRAFSHNLQWRELTLLSHLQRKEKQEWPARHMVSVLRPSRQGQSKVIRSGKDEGQVNMGETPRQRQGINSVTRPNLKEGVVAHCEEVGADAQNNLALRWCARLQIHQAARSFD